MEIEECDFCKKVGSCCEKRSAAEKCRNFEKEHADKILEYKIWHYKFFKDVDYKDE